MDEAMVQREFRKLKQKIAKLEQKARAEHDLKIAAETRAHDAKLQFKGMKNHLARCELDARRYQWLRSIGVRFPGESAWLHDRTADRIVDGKIAEDGRPPTVTEQRVSHRRPRGPLNPVLPATFGEHKA